MRLCLLLLLALALWANAGAETFERTKTLCWLNVPTHLPNRTNLEMHVSLREPTATQFPHAMLRLQLTRKVEFSPIFVR